MIAKRHTLAAALRVAAAQYEQDASGLGQDPRHQRLALCFKDQAADAKRLADEIEQADVIQLED